MEAENGDRTTGEHPRPFVTPPRRPAVTDLFLRLRDADDPSATLPHSPMTRPDHVSQITRQHLGHPAAPSFLFAAGFLAEDTLGDRGGDRSIPKNDNFFSMLILSNVKIVTFRPRSLSVFFAGWG